MHIGGLTIVEGPPPDDGRVPRTDPPAPAPACRATATSSPTRRSTAAGRCGSTTRASTSTTTCATPPCRRPGGRDQLQDADRADLLAAARPLQAAVGDVADRGPRGQPLRADHEDPPLADRRHRRRRPRDGAVRPLARPAADADAPAARGSRTRAGHRAAARGGARRRRSRRRGARRRAHSTRCAHPERALARAREAARASARSSGRG